MKFKQFLLSLNEGSKSPKYKIHNTPMFSNKAHQIIFKEIESFVRKNKNTLRDIHFPKGVKKSDYNSSKVFVLPITDIKVLGDLCLFLEKNEKITTVVHGDADVLFNGKKIFTLHASSGRGFYFEDEATQDVPNTAQQESGTIESLKYYMKNEKHITAEQLQKILNFKFSQDWIDNFKKQVNHITDFMGNIKGYKIDLDSDSKSIRHSMFSNPVTKEITAKDNWNPSDIWLYNNKSEILSSLKNCKTLMEYNAVMKELFLKRVLVGISLKKISGAGSYKIVDLDKTPPFDLKWDKSEFSFDNRYLSLKTKGYPKGFEIYMRAKAKTVSAAGDIRIFFEGKEKSSKVFLGAISKKLVSSLSYEDLGNVPKDVTTEDLEVLVKECSHLGILMKNESMIHNFTLLDRQYVFVLLRYAKTILSAPGDMINDLAYSGYKMSKSSSIHLKVS